MTSSPGPMPSAISASSSASVPDETLIACATPSCAASTASSASISGPMMKRWLSATRVIAARISSRSGWYWAWRSSSGTLIGTFDILPAGLDRRPRCAVRLAALDGLALVVVLLALGQADGDLHASLRAEVEAHRNERHPLLHRL